MHESIFKLTKTLYIELDKIKDSILNVDEVLIENQPSMINPTMKTISALIYGYFVMAMVKSDFKCRLKNVKFYAPSNKLKIKALPVPEVKEDIVEEKKEEIVEEEVKKGKKKKKNDDTVGEKIKTKFKKGEDHKVYKLTKDTGVKYCKHILKNNVELVKYFDTFKKQDDLADAFLHGYHYLFGKNEQLLSDAVMKEIGLENI